MALEHYAKLPCATDGVGEELSYRVLLMALENYAKLPCATDGVGELR